METLLTDRILADNITTLSGDIGITGDNGDNSYHVIYSAGLSSATVLDGFTITLGQADGAGLHSEGAGIYNNSSNITIENCRFHLNSADREGGGMLNTNNSSPIINNCVFSENRTENDDGGGMMNRSTSSPSVTNCIFTLNYSYLDGGGMYNQNSSNPTITNCIFDSNSAENNAGAMYNFDNSSPTINDCTFSGNIAPNEGGGMVNSTYSSPSLTNCTFSGNESVNFEGGGLFNKNYSNAVMVNCTFSGNKAADNGGGLFIDHDCIVTIANCTFINNTADYDNNGTGFGGGICNGISSNSTISISNTIVVDNISGASANDDIYNETGGMVNSSYNIVGFFTGYTAGTGDITGDQPSLNLGPLQNNGGATETHALLTGSIAIDAGDPAFTSPLDFDQRGDGFPPAQQLPGGYRGL